MQHTGILRDWHDERGFGFIAPTQGGREVFVHIGAFPRDGTRPVAGERLGYELATGRDGRPEAVNVTRLAVGSRPVDRTTSRDDGRSNRPDLRDRAGTDRGDRLGSSLLGAIVLAVVLLVVGAWGYRQYTTSMHRKELASRPAVKVDTPWPPAAEPVPRLAAPAERAATSRFTCDGRTHCSQMTSCEEATWFIQHCPGTVMDGDGDGVPCEQQHCRQ